MPPRLKSLGERVIVTAGASSGVGPFTARVVAARGRGGEAIHVACDVGRHEEEVDRAAWAAVEAFGRLDTWVNDAGTSILGDQAPPVQSTHASAKFAVHGLTDAPRQEIGHNRRPPISVPLIHPGRTDTPRDEHAGNHVPRRPVQRGMHGPRARNRRRGDPLARAAPEARHAGGRSGQDRGADRLPRPAGAASASKRPSARPWPRPP
jgi:NAD(P)-dependent dehydrogenase (short-subunit alcohol dehydrogenase family)